MIRYYILFLSGVFIASLAQIILKKSAVRKYRTVAGRYLNGNVLLSYLVLCFVTLLTTFAYRGIPLKAGPVLQSSGYIFIALLSQFFLKESISLIQWKGIFLIVSGILVFYL